MAFCSAQVTVCPAQGINISAYGQGCSPFFAAPTLSGSFDASTCILTLNMSSAQSCCNTFRNGRFLIVGNNAANTPVPAFGPTCNLLAQVDLIVALGANAADEILVALPPWVQPAVDIYLQGANSFFSTFSFTTDVELTNGVKLTTF